MNSILNSVKKMLGIVAEYNQFDVDIIIHINTVFSILTQLGAGPSRGFSISDETTNWDDFLPSNDPRLELVKTYMYLKVRLMFDPPTTSNVLESITRLTDELEWRINMAVDPGEGSG